MSMIEGVLMGMAQRARQQTDAEDREERRRKRAEEAEDRAFTMSERARQVKMRTDMGNAAAEVQPVEVKATRPETMDNRDVGQPGEAALPTASYDVGGKRFTDRTQADAAAAEANTPQAITTRMADVAMRNGEPLKAQQLRVGSMQEQTERYKLNDAMRADLDAKFNADLQANVRDWDSLDKFISESAGDGHGGKMKVKTVVSADGKTRVVNVVGDDGKLHPTEKVVPNTADGLAQAIAELSRMPPEKKLAHLHQKAMLAQQAARDAETGRHNLTMEGLAKDKTAANIEIAQIRADAAAERRAAAAAAKGLGGMTLADLKDGHKGIASTLNADWKTQIEAETDPAKLKALKVARESEIATVQRLYTGAMQAGFGLTPEQAIVAFRTGEIARQTFKSKDGSGTVRVDGILYGGRFIPLADNPGAMPGAKPPSAAAPTPAPSAPEAGQVTMAQATSRAEPTANSFAGNEDAFKAMPLAQLKRYVAVGNAYAKRELAARSAGADGKRKADKAADDELVRQAAAQGLSAE